MIVSVLQESLKRAIATVAPAVAGKSTLPVLGNILLTARDGRLSLAATNLEIGITDSIGAQVEAEGAVTLPAKLLGDVAGSLPNDKVTLTLDARTQAVKIACGRFTTTIKGIESDEFPTIPTVTGVSVELPTDILVGMIGRVAFAAASDDSRPVLAGVRMQIGDNLSLAAADGFRMAVESAVIGGADPIEAIIPARSLVTLAKIAAADAAVQIEVGASQATFTAGDTTLITRLIDGRFPDVDRIIPTKHTTRAVVEVAALTKAVKLASFFATQSQNVVRIAATEGVITVSANAAEIGDNTGSVDAMTTGEGVINLNVAYLTEVLGAIKEAQIAIELQTPTSPAVLRPVGRDGYVHVIMPMNSR